MVSLREAWLETGVELTDLHLSILTFPLPLVELARFLIANRSDDTAPVEWQLDCLLGGPPGEKGRGPWSRSPRLSLKPITRP